MTSDEKYNIEVSRVEQSRHQLRTEQLERFIKETYGVDVLKTALAPILEQEAAFKKELKTLHQQYFGVS